MQLHHHNKSVSIIAPPLTLWHNRFQHHLPAMLSRLPNLRTNMFDGYVVTFEASASTVLVRSWCLTDKKARRLTDKKDRHKISTP
jgi:hypothetical protein